MCENGAGLTVSGGAFHGVAVRCEGCGWEQFYRLTGTDGAGWPRLAVILVDHADDVLLRRAARKPG